MPVKDKHPVTERQNHAAVNVVMWKTEYTSLYQSNLCSVLEKP